MNPIWITDSKFALVTQQDGVFYYDVDHSEQPELVVPYENLRTPCEYGVDPTMRFHFIRSQDQGLFNLELYDSYTRERFVCEGTACCFAKMNLQDGSAPQHSKMLFCYCEKQQDGRNHRLHTIQGNKRFMNLFVNYTLYIMEIGDVAIDQQQKFQRIAEVPMQQAGDYPIMMHDYPNSKALAVLTLHGYLYIYYVLPEPFIAFQDKIFDGVALAQTRNRQTDGMVLINEKGQIYEIAVGDDFIHKMFDLKIYLKDYRAAAQIGLLAEIMSNSELINLFQNLP